VTVAGAGDIPLADGDDVMLNLRQALTAYGDPIQPILVARRELLVLVVRATVWLLPDFSWDSVEPAIRAALLDRFGFARQELGASVDASSVISTIQRVPGVDGVDLEIFDSISESATAAALDAALATLTCRARISVAGARWASGPDTRFGPAELRPAQLATLLASVPDTLMLELR
jgi:hypothetical protein